MTPEQKSRMENVCYAALGAAMVIFFGFLWVILHGPIG